MNIDSMRVRFCAGAPLFYKRFNPFKGVIAITREAELFRLETAEYEVQSYFQSVCAEGDMPRRALYIRAGNALSRAGVETMSQLCHMREDEIRKIRGIGANCFPIIMGEYGKFRNVADQSADPAEMDDVLR